MNGQITVKDIVLAEDDKDDVLLFEEAVHEIDASLMIRHAENGNLLFVLLKEKIPDILFLDIYMPCKDGVTCIMEIRKNRAYDKLPVIIYSGSERDITIDECYENGANYYITKTAHYEDLVKKLQHILSFNWKRQLVYPPKDQFVI